MKDRTVSFKCDEELYQWLRSEAAKKRSTMTAVIYEALSDRWEAEKLFDSLGGVTMIREALRKQLDEGEK